MTDRKLEKHPESDFDLSQMELVDTELSKVGKNQEKFYVSWSSIS